MIRHLGKIAKSILIGMIVTVCLISAYQSEWVVSYLQLDAQLSLKDWVLVSGIGGVSCALATYLVDWMYRDS